jgi:signal transduction histidine kinase
MMGINKTAVLNVDDQDAQRYVKTRDLERAGFAVTEARNGAQALAMVEQHSPTVVLLDVQLPDISGFEVCKHIKQKWPGTMILMTSATFTSATARTAGLDSGADSFLVQPAEPLELAAAINALARIRRSEEQLRELNDTLEQRIQDRVADLGKANASLRDEIVQRQKAEAALVQAEKMQAVGQLTGGLAHDFNNLLTAVVGNLDLIRGRSTDERIRRWADNAISAAQRGARLTSQLLAFSRTQKLTTVPVDVNSVIAGMHDLLSQTLGPGITIKTELDSGLPPATADPNQLELAILNLSINARDAMPQGGSLTISTGLEPADSESVTIAVSDTGTGMLPEVAMRAFDPFYTTKPPGKGTGLGLSQVYGIAKQSGGNVTLKSEIQKGTSVIIYLPRAEGSTPLKTQLSSEILSAGQTDRLLVVDDDDDVRAVIVGLLAELGYQVREAADGEAARAILVDF